MIINHTFGFIFVHIPKAAGTTITSTFSQFTQYCDQEIGATIGGEALQRYYNERFGIRKHSTSEEIIRVVGQKDWARYYKFSFVRNPYHRLESSFHFLRAWDGAPENFKQNISKFSNFAEFVKTDFWLEYPGPDNIFRPQVSWLCHPKKPREIAVDFLGKTENILDDMMGISRDLKLNLKLESAPHLNVTKPYEKYREWKDAEIERIRDYYALDFELCGYSPDPSKGI